MRFVLLALVLVVPAFAQEPLSHIGFGSCLRQDKDQAIARPLLATKPQLFVFLGDNIYADTTDLDVMREKYKKQATKDVFKGLKGMCPLMATWDDHDYGGDDADRDYPKKKESQQAFLDFFEVPNDAPLRKQEGIYTSRVFGPEGKRVQVILLDMRYHLSPLKKGMRRGTYVPDDSESATFLGTAQWKWLGEQLKVPAEVRLIGSSVQFVAEDHPYEKWANFPRERKKMVDLIRETKANGVVFLSGDRHLSELAVLDGEVGYPLYDITSSGLNQGNKIVRKVEQNRHRLAIQDVGDNFGLVRIDWSRRDPAISLEIHDTDGDVVIRQKFPLSRLQIRDKALASGQNLGAEALKMVDKEWTVEFVVNAVGASRTKTMYYLNSEKDFRSDANFVVVLNAKTLGKELKALGDPVKFYPGKKIKVKGTVTLYEGRPQMMVKSLSQVEVVMPEK